MNPGQDNKAPGAPLYLTALLLAGDVAARQQEHPVTVEATYTGELWSSVTGGESTGSVYLDNLDIAAGLDADVLWGWSGTQLFVQALYNNGDSLSEESTGDLQTVSNIESGANGLRLYEAWMNTGIGRSGSLRFGLYDLNTEFDVLDSSQVFIHSGHGIGTGLGQTGRNGPSIFPITSLAARFAWNWDNPWALRAAVLDGVPGDRGDPDQMDIDVSSEEGALLVAELERSTSPAKLLLGGWRYTARFESWPDTHPARELRSRGNKGAYVRGEWRPTPDLAVFARLGRAAGEFNMISEFFGAGLRWAGPLSSRPMDSLGVAVAWAEASDEYQEARRLQGERTEDREIALELTYRLALGNRLVLRPDLQYIRNPGLARHLDDALAVGLRLELLLL